MKTSILKPCIKPGIAPLTLAVLLATHTAQAATLNARLDQGVITTGDSVTLSISLPADGGAQPDLTPLKKDFDILGTGSSTQMQVINGNSTSSRQLNITLAPHGKGSFTIPALKVGSDETAPLQLTVKDAPTVSGSQAGQPVWVEMETPFKDGKQQVMVQQEVPLTVRLYSSIPLRNVSLNLPPMPGVTVEKLGADNQHQVQRNGQTYEVLEQHYAVFPEQSGELKIPPVTLRAVTPDPNQQRGSGFGGGMFNDDFFKNALKNNPLAQQMMNDDFFNDPFGMFNSGKEVSLRSNAISLPVAHIPDAAKGKSWLPARKVTLTDSWQGKPPSLRSGEPASLTLTVTADGLTGEQIPAITLPDIPGVRVYSEPAQAESHTNGEQVTGTSTQTFTLIPEQTGKAALPAISLPWWNTQTQSMQTAELPARTLAVAQGSATAVAMPPPAAASALAVSTAAQTSPQPAPAASSTSSTHSGFPDHTDDEWLAGGLLALALLLGGSWLWRRRKGKTPEQPAQTASSPLTPSVPLAASQPSATARKQVLETARADCLNACANNDPYLSAKNLLAWARQVWPENPPVSLPELAKRARAETEVRELHQHLYRPNQDDTPWSGEALAAALRQGLKPKAETKALPADQGLPPLYPA